MGTALSVAGVFLVALSPLVVGTIVLRAVRWASRRGGRHRRRAGAPAPWAPSDEARYRNHP